MVKSLITEKIEEVIDELKLQKIWKIQPPGWVTDFSDQPGEQKSRFADWLQFILLPYLQQAPFTEKKNYIAPQAVRFLGEDVHKGKLLQLLVELDSLL